MIKQRVQRVSSQWRVPADAAIPREKNTWLHASEGHVFSLLRVMESLQSFAEQDGVSELNPDEFFRHHLRYMHCYMDVLWHQPSFQSYCIQHGITKGFLHTLVEMHDFGRWVVNGPLPLTFIDGVSSGLLKSFFPTYPTQFLHRIQWITGEDPFLEAASFSDHIAIIVKAIDTLGKSDPNTGELVSPDTFWKNDGPYAKWLQRQIAARRFPFAVSISHGMFGRRKQVQITAEKYAETDQELTQLGVKTAEKLSSISWGEIQGMTQALFTASSPLQLR